MSRAWRIAVTTRSRRVASPRKAARRPVPSELAQELCSRERSLVAGEFGPEGLHERRRPGSRDAEELLDVAAREELAVELFELADGVGEGEQPAGRGGHGATRRPREGRCGGEEGRRASPAPG